MINSEIRSSESPDDNDVEYAIGALMGALIRNALKENLKSSDHVTAFQKNKILFSLSKKLNAELDDCVNNFAEAYEAELDKHAAWNDLYHDQSMHQ